VTPRLFIALANPALAALLEGTVGGDWLGQLERLRQLESCADDSGFCARWREVKRLAKERLPDHVQRSCGISLDFRQLI
jgi:starch phosphorylase